MLGNTADNNLGIMIMNRVALRAYIALSIVIVRHLTICRRTTIWTEFHSKSLISP